MASLIATNSRDGASRLAATGILPLDGLSHRDKPLLERGKQPRRFERRGWLSSAPRIQMIEVEQRVEQEEETALRLVSPHRIGRKQHDVAATNRNVDHRWRAR